MPSTSKGLIGKHAWQVTDETVAQVHAMLASGMLLSRVPAKLGIDPTTFYRHVRKNPKLQAALSGAQLALADVEVALFQNATQPAIGPKGDPIGPPGGSVEAQKFILARRGGKRWQEIKDDGDGIKTTGVQVVIMLPDNQRPKVIDAYQK